jgi:exonuclease III
MAGRVATWNVNSLRVRLPHVLAWLARCPVDVLALQETKLTDPDFPHSELAAHGYHSIASGQKTYNGVALLSRSLRGCAPKRATMSNSSSSATSTLRARIATCTSRQNDSARCT